jgi:hypothetical protein
VICIISSNSLYEHKAPLWRLSHIWTFFHVLLSISSIFRYRQMFCRLIAILFHDIAICFSLYLQHDLPPCTFSFFLHSRLLSAIFHLINKNGFSDLFLSCVTELWGTTSLHTESAAHCGNLLTMCGFWDNSFDFDSAFH